MADIIRAVLEVRGWNQADLAAHLKTSQTTVSRWLDGSEPRGDKRDRIRKLAADSGVLSEGGPTRNAVPVMGFIGAGAQVDPELEQVPLDGFDQVELPFALDDDVIAFQVKGDSMRPIYNDGDVVVVRSEPRVSVDRLVGEEAAVRTYDGKRYLKHVIQGSKRHTYTLLSANAEPMLDVRVAWASEIVAIVPARQTRHLGRKARANAGKGRATPKDRSTS